MYFGTTHRFAYNPVEVIKLQDSSGNKLISAHLIFAFKFIVTGSVKMSIADKLSGEPVRKTSDVLLNVRLAFFSVAWLQVVTAAAVILPIDMTVDEDPRVRAYSWLKWKFITAWFNCANIAYFPLCIYCDWKEKCQQADLPSVKRVRRIRDLLFTCFLFPFTMYGDIFFWRLYYTDINLITPVALFDYLPWWGQHSLHTVTLIGVLIDLIIVPRQRPKSIKPRFKVMNYFLLAYLLVVLESYVRGEYVYTILEVYPVFDQIILVMRSYCELSFYFTLQWYVVDFVWAKREANTPMRSKEKL